MSSADLSAAQELALLDLYKREIILRLQAIYVNPSLSFHISELLEQNEIDRLRLSATNEKFFAEKLWEMMIGSPMKGAIYLTLLNYLAKENKDLHSLLVCTEEEHRSYFCQVLIHYEELMRLIDVKIVLEFLGTIQPYENIVKLISENIQDEDDRMQKKILFRTIPLLGSDAFLDILQAMYDVNAEVKAFIEKVAPNFPKRYALVCDDRANNTSTIQFLDLEDPIQHAIEKIRLTKDKSQTPYAFNLKWDRLSRLRTAPMRKLAQALELHINKEEPIYLRNYQKELCLNALKGENTIICAPTGSGKTIVAAHIIKEYLNGCRMNKKSQCNGKALFLIPNTFILEQQANTMRKYLQHAFKIISTSGADQTPLEGAIEDNDVIVTTPQMIVNLLDNNSRVYDIELPRKPFYLSTFGMIIFDEAHGTRKNSPYSKIMLQYHRDKFSVKLGLEKKLPQIIGLTASIGVGSAKNLQQAFEHVVSTCGLLDSPTISMVRSNLDDLNLYSMPTADEFHKSMFGEDSLRRIHERFIGTILRFMNALEDDILKLLGTGHKDLPEFQFSQDLFDDFGISKTKRDYSFGMLSKPPKVRGQAYEHWLYNAVRTHIPEDPKLNEITKGKILKKMEVLMELYDCLQMASLFPTSYAFEELQKYFSADNFQNIDSLAISLWKEIQQTLKSFVLDRCSMVDDLVSILCDSKLVEDFRVIIFIKTRHFAAILNKIINENGQMRQKKIKSECITGLNSKLEDEPTSKQKQADKLARFESGETKCLIATSVAEEGLDIAKCNLVIKYSYVSSEIAHVQRRGRARAENSRCILLASDEKLIKQEKTNVQKETLMMKVMDVLLSERFPLRKKVEVEVQNIWQDIQRKDAERREKVNKLASSKIDYDVECKTCSSFLCKTSDVKIDKFQYCVSSTKFWDKVTYGLNKVMKNKYEGVGVIYCRGQIPGSICSALLGRILNVKNVPIPILTAEALKFSCASNGCASNKQTRVCRRWKQITEEIFVPQALKNYDVLNMRDAPNAPNLSQFERIICNVDNVQQ